MSRFSALQISGFAHAIFVALVSLWFWWGQSPKSTQKIEIEVYDSPKVVSAKTALDAAPSRPTSPPPEEKRAVFGVQRNAITTSEISAVNIKKGNSIAKENDNLQLNADDADALPIPADEFLITQMPKITKEVRALYPPEAKKAGITGAVVFEILIDQTGKVREARLISGPGSGLNEAARDAIQQFEFNPAKIKDQVVAVRVRYTYRFVLEAM